MLKLYWVVKAIQAIQEDFKLMQENLICFNEELDRRMLFHLSQYEIKSVSVVIKSSDDDILIIHTRISNISKF